VQYIDVIMICHSENICLLLDGFILVVYDVFVYI